MFCTDFFSFCRESLLNWPIFYQVHFQRFFFDHADFIFWVSTKQILDQVDFRWKNKFRCKVHSWPEFPIMFKNLSNSVQFSQLACESFRVKQQKCNVERVVELEALVFTLLVDEIQRQLFNPTAITKLTLKQRLLFRNATTFGLISSKAKPCWKRLCWISPTKI